MKMTSYDDLFTAQQAPRGQDPFDVQAWAAKKKEQRDAVYARIDEYALAMRSNGKLFQSYLDVQARFERYSVSNAILIADQMPDATRLADFETWKANGVYVQRGAEAITILEPGKEYIREEDGSTGVYYNPRRVFDISQTNSRQPPAPVVARDERLLLKALMNNAPCGFTVTNDLPERVNAAYDQKENIIRVRPGLDATSIFRVIACQLAHAHIVKGNIECENPSFVAYSVSYLLCKRNGISTDGYSFSQMPEGYGGMDAQAIRSEAGIVREIAGEISADMSRLLAAQQKAQKNRNETAR